MASKQVTTFGSSKWNAETLFEYASKCEAKEVPLAPFSLDVAVWEAEPMTVGEVLEHAKRIWHADLTQPIIVSAAGWVMDGHHRIAKAHLEGRETILMCQFEVDPPPDESL